MINSRLGLFSAAHSWALLLPKLRSHFAEFLSYSSLAHLRILSSPMCVHFRYGSHILSLETFLGSSSTAFRTRLSFPYASRLLVSDGGFACHPDISLAPALPAAGCSFLSPSFLHIYMSTGISTCCPSTTPLGLALGPDLPRADEPSSGNLGFSVRGILTHVPLLTPAFSLP